ncbi:MAG: ABC transporter permease [Bryobacteraceae bacterium]
MMLDSLRQDLTYAIRSFAKTPALTATIVVSMALGIGANTTVFSIVNELLITIVPVRDPERLFVMTRGQAPSCSIPAYLEFRDQTRQVFEGVTAHSLIPAAANVRAGGSAQRVWGGLVSGNFFQVTGAPLFLGRGIFPNEDEVRGRDAVVVLGYDLWRRLGEDRTIVGKRITLSGLPYTVVGVTAPGFLGLDRGILNEFWAPLAMRTHLAADIASIDMSRNCQWIEMTARLRPGVTREQALAAANLVHARAHKQFEPNDQLEPMVLVRAGHVGTFLQEILNPLVSALAVVVGLLLLIACANVANLLLARAATRQHEIGVRLAVGADRRRIVRQLLTESILLSTAGAVLGFLLTIPVAAALAQIQPQFGIPMRFDFTPDVRVLGFTAALAVLTGVLFGLAPALTGTRGSLSEAMTETGWGGGGSHRGRLASTLVGVQVALSLILLVTAGLFLRSLHNASSIDVGMKPQGALMAAVDPIGPSYSLDKKKRLFHDLQERVEALPGVQALGYIDLPPLSMAESNSNFSDADSAAGQRIRGDKMRVSQHYFDASGISLLQGRDFETARDDKARVALINRTLAQRLFGQDSPIGRHVRDGNEQGTKNVYEVIGIVRDAKVESVGEATVPSLFLHLVDFDGSLSFYGVTMIARTRGDPLLLATAMQREVSALDPELPLFNVKTLQSHIDEALLLPRVSGALFGAFGSIGLVLALVGLYGVVNYSVRTRTREIGIRMALGARPARVAGSVLRQGLVVVGAGLSLGLAVAYSLSRFMASLLYGIMPTDPMTFLGVPTILLVASLAALLLPARRASRIEPMTALRIG